MSTIATAIATMARIAAVDQRENFPTVVATPTPPDGRAASVEPGSRAFAALTSTVY
jgi:hypothetical protein